MENYNQQHQGEKRLHRQGQPKIVINVIGLEETISAMSHIGKMFTELGDRMRKRRDELLATLPHLQVETHTRTEYGMPYPSGDRYSYAITNTITMMISRDKVIEQIQDYKTKGYEVSAHYLLSGNIHYWASSPNGHRTILGKYFHR